MAEKLPQSGNGRYGRRLAEVLEYATQVFGEKGYDAASIRDIARASGTSLAGLYYYFQSKEHLLYLIQKDAFETLLARLEERLRSESDPVARLRCLILNHEFYFMEHPRRMKVLSHESDTLKGPHHLEIAELKRKYYRRALELVEGVQRARNLKHLNPRLAVMSLFGMMNWVYTWHNPTLDPAAGELSDHMAGVFLNGILGPTQNPKTIRKTKEKANERHRTDHSGKATGHLSSGAGRRNLRNGRSARQHLHV